MSILSCLKSISSNLHIFNCYSNIYILMSQLVFFLPSSSQHNSVRIVSHTMPRLVAFQFLCGRCYCTWNQPNVIEILNLFKTASHNASTYPLTSESSYQTVHMFEGGRWYGNATECQVIIVTSFKTLISSTSIRHIQSTS